MWSNSLLEFDHVDGRSFDALVNGVGWVAVGCCLAFWSNGWQVLPQLCSSECCRPWRNWMGCYWILMGQQVCWFAGPSDKGTQHRFIRKSWLHMRRLYENLCSCRCWSGVVVKPAMPHSINTRQRLSSSYARASRRTTVTTSKWLQVFHRQRDCFLTCSSTSISNIASILSRHCIVLSCMIMMSWTGGLLYFHDWQNLQYVSSAAFLMAVYSNYLRMANANLVCPDGQISPEMLLKFAESQVFYFTVYLWLSSIPN